MEMLSIIFSVSFIFSVIRVSTPILFGSMSSLMAEHCGISNIGIEGMMLTCALTGVVVSSFAGQSALVGLIAAIVIGVLLGLLLGFLVMKLKADAVITGVAINLTASGATVFCLYLASGEKGISSSLLSGVLPKINIPFIENIPFVGNVLSGHNLLTYVGFFLIPILSLLLYKTPLGMHIRSAGEVPDALDSVGVSATKTRYIALALSGMLAALGGAYMSMGYVTYFVKDMVAGRGFIAIAAAALGRNRPVPTLIACLLFGVADAFANNPSSQNLGMPTELVSAIPYAVTIVALVIYSYRILKKKKIELAKVI